MNISGTINVALNGFEANVTTKEEAKALILSSMGEVVKALAEQVPVPMLESFSMRFDMGFEVHDGRIKRVIFG